ncbi:hypothetical protein F0U62_00235 [Cystobacter fuscus]|uniref:hypothetical protein n=1 Tax=Cystobacter fuscus TaxID=43 RepID=UPI002B31EF40|nr:hypothetical protein F0U62_00235 [Cystobacter fuscus]
MTTIRTTQTTTTTTVTNDLPNPAQATQVAAQLAQAINQLGQVLSAATQQTGAALPKDGMMQAQSQAPVNLSGGAQQPMDVYGAAAALKNHFAVAEGIGMNGKGKGSGDGNIGLSELKNLANPASGAPAQLQQAAQFLLAHPAMAKVIDGAKGKGGDVHINMADLNKILSSAPGGSGAMPAASNNLAPMMSSAMASLLGSSPVGGGSLSAPPTTAMSPAMASGSFAAPTQQAPMDVYGAAAALKNHFAVAEGIGMNGKGKGSGDGNIGLSELKNLANPASGAPAQLQQAAQFLLAHPAMAKVIDGAKGKGGDVHINMADLNKILSSAPAGSGAGPSAAQSQLQNLLGNAPAGGGAGSSQLQNLQNMAQNMAQTMSSAMASLLGSSPIAGSAPMQQPMGMQQPGATGGMDVYKAASALDKHFAVAEGIGMNGKGKGSGDGNIGLSELRNLANPKSGAPAELQQAAQFLLAHPSMAKVIDGAKGKGGDVHISRADLKNMMANAPAGNQGGAPMMANAPIGNQGAQGGNSLMGIFNQAAGLPTAPPTTAMSPAMASGSFSSPVQQAPMDVYGAAQTLKNHFAVAEGIGTNGKGKGSGDGNIGLGELRNLANPANGAPPQLQQAAQFLLAHPSMAKVIDGAKGKGGDVHINMADLNKIISSAPGGSGGTQGVAGTSAKDIIMEQVKATAFKMNIS